MIFHRRIDQLWGVVIGLSVASVISLIAAGAAWWGWKTSPDRIWVDVIPNLTQGMSTQPGQRQPVNVYSFASLIMQKLNNWSIDGKEDFPNLIATFQPYLTQRGESHLVSLLECKVRLQELSNRKRTLGLADFFQYDAVEEVSGRWRVSMDFHLVETVEDLIVKDSQLSYRMWFANHQVDKDANPWGLGFDGFDNLNELIDERCLDES